MLGFTARQFGLWWKMLPMMQEVWLATRPVVENEGRVATIVKGALSLRPGLAARNLAARINRVRITRQDLNEYWRSLFRLGWHRANPLVAPWKALREWALLVQLLYQLRTAAI